MLPSAAASGPLLTDVQVRERLDVITAKAHGGDAFGALQDLLQLLIHTGQGRDAAEMLDRAKSALVDPQPGGGEAAAASLADMLSRFSLEPSAVACLAGARPCQSLPDPDAAMATDGGFSFAPPAQPSQPGDSPTCSWHHARAQAGGGAQTQALNAAAQSESAAQQLQDGSCFRCPRCGGVVSRSRREEHARSWCQGVG